MSGLRFAANLGWLFTEHPFERRFDAAAAAGFTTVELANPYELPAARLRTLLDQAGLRQILINSPVGPLGSPYSAGWGCLPDRVREFRDSVEHALEYAAVLGCPLVHLRAGTRPPDLPRADGLARLTANVAWAAERAGTAGPRLTLEAINQRDSPRYLVDSQELAAAIASAAGPERVGVQFDVYHCQVAQGDLTTRLDALSGSIAHVQIADAPSRAEPGTGEINWSHVLGRLEELGYGGWVGCEYRPAGTTVGGLGWLDQLGYADPSGGRR